jgi:NAD(P)-dependent dehydrogenase (short-subunit alcohol dehydrogenase family)
MASFTNTVHSKPYPAISPTLPALSQAGKSVLITGGSTGIGYAIAVAFAQASASTIIITGRRTELLQNAASQLTKAVPGFKGRLLFRTCDVSDRQDTDLLWSELEKEGIAVDVLVINAARLQTRGPLLQTPLNDAWVEFLTNVRSNLDFVQRFNRLNERFPNGVKKVCTVTLRPLLGRWADEALKTGIDSSLTGYCSPWLMSRPSLYTILEHLAISRTTI